MMACHYTRQVFVVLLWSALARGQFASSPLISTGYLAGNKNNKLPLIARSDSPLIFGFHRLDASVLSIGLNENFYYAPRIRQATRPSECVVD